MVKKKRGYHHLSGFMFAEYYVYLLVAFPTPDLTIIANKKRTAVTLKTFELISSSLFIQLS